MNILFRNNAVSTLASGALITDTTIVVQPGEGSRFPNPGPGQYFIITVQNGAAFEIMHCTARSNDVMTVVRAREGTVAQPWAAGSSVTMRITAGCFEAFAQQVNTLNAELANRALLNHTHTTAEVVGLDAELANRAALTGATFTGPVVVPNATADGHAVNRVTGDGRYARLTGATFTGDLSISRSDPVLLLNKTASGQVVRVIGALNGAWRWGIELGQWSPETGSNAGSDFVIVRYNDSGEGLGIPLAINRATGAVTLEAPLTLPASNPTDANHATRKAYVDELVDAAGKWEKVVDVAVTNSTVIDVTGFSLQNYRMATLLLVGAQVSSASTGAIVLQVYRNGALVNTGYNYVRHTAVASTHGVSTHNTSGHVINFDGIDVNPILIKNYITQTASNREPVIMTRSLHVSYGGYNSMVIHRVNGRVTAGSGWVNGFRISAPVEFQNNVGRVIVLGLKP